MDRHREAHPSFAPTGHGDPELDLALERAHFRLLVELYRQRRPVGKLRRWPTVRTREVVVSITSARKWKETREPGKAPLEGDC
jgi:hypothetical protein